MGQARAEILAGPRNVPSHTTVPNRRSGNADKTKPPRLCDNWPVVPVREALPSVKPVSVSQQVKLTACREGKSINCLWLSKFDGSCTKNQNLFVDSLVSKCVMGWLFCKWASTVFMSVCIVSAGCIHTCNGNASEETLSTCVSCLASAKIASATRSPGIRTDPVRSSVVSMYFRILTCFISVHLPTSAGS